MKPAIQLQISNPCHENWAGMTRSNQGRFCQSCSKQVVDFSIMTDQQILDYLSVDHGNICGRLTNEQQQRTLQLAAVPVKVKWWYTLLMPLLLILNKAAAQTPVRMGKVAMHQPLDTTPRNPVKEVLPTDPAQQEIRGRVTDERGKPVAGATVRVKEWSKAVATDTGGNYRIHVTALPGIVTLTVGNIGYESVSRNIVAGGISYENIAFTQVELNGMLGELVVIQKPRKKPPVVKKVVDTLANSLTTTAKQPFIVYPNPVGKGQSFTVFAKAAGDYTMEVMSSDGTLLLKQRHSNAKGGAEPVMVPASWTTGIYFVRLVNEKDKKQYTEKILVQ